MHKRQGVQRDATLAMKGFILPIFSMLQSQPLSVCREYFLRIPDRHQLFTQYYRTCTFCSPDIPNITVEYYGTWASYWLQKRSHWISFLPYIAHGIFCRIVFGF